MFIPWKVPYIIRVFNVLSYPLPRNAAHNLNPEGLGGEGQRSNCFAGNSQTLINSKLSSNYSTEAFICQKEL